VSGRFLQPDPARKNLSFLRESAGIDGLGERISDVKLETSEGMAVAFKRLIPGEYLAESGFDVWSYKFDLKANKRPSAAAHVSWVNDSTGVLMLDDLLPQFGASGNPRTAKVILNPPAGWKIWTTEKNSDRNVFDAADIEKAVFIIGKDFREVKTSNPSLNLIILGQWQFADSDAADIAGEIYSNYIKLFGTAPSSPQIALLKFPQTVQPGEWEADTHGQTVTVISSDMPFKTQSLQRLHEQLRHEIFHLWLPYGVNLSGNYDWFYEGFALYTALRSGVAVNRIRFDDFLDTLSRAYNIDNISGSKVSLIDASKSRWNGANTQIYARGMLVAFLCDLALLEHSRGKSDVNDLLRKIYDDYRYPKPRQDGNAAIFKILQSYPELKDIAKRYIEGTEKLDWRGKLAEVGIESREENYTTFLSVIEKPNSRQKDLLNRLGYNNWRKLTQNSR
jgi:predicted metalloprotease with PDZ domain